ncbi:sigma-70 family RNA polymerase sigma factor [Camelliibacillus cellulosilyticus]|uniref:Sigma-70 family RNA polymerase sigma factor n=1 Tax=Camelliibacillus cellulosilyticus TaxID=2174486 RepID=A0ABV9GMI3_9BACL
MDRKDTTRHSEEMAWIQTQDAESIIETLMDEYGSDLKKVAYSYVKDWGKAEDIAQDVFVTCFRKIKTFKGHSSIKTWLFRITINRCKDELKSWSFRHIRVGRTEALATRKGEAPSPEREVIRQDDNQKLAALVMTLPLKYKEVIILHYYSELKTEEIAESLKLNANTVRTRLGRARKLLKAMYEEGPYGG